MVDLPFRKRPYRSDIFADKIKKQRWDRPSSAIVAHMQKDGLMYVHPDEKQTRTFTPREGARIQSFRDRFRFLGPMTQQFKQIGNAVPCVFGEAIARHLVAFDEGRAEAGNSNHKLSRYTGTDHDSWRQSLTGLERQMVLYE